MATKTAAKKTEKFDLAKWLTWNISTGALCPQCGHDAQAHEGEHEKVADMRCPAVPPTKKPVTVDEAVAAKTDFERDLAAATVDETAERKKLALVHFDRRINTATRAVIQLEYLRPMRNNPRGDDLGDVSGLVTSIEQNGFIGALNVREVEENVFEVWAGNRRLKAAQKAGLQEVPCDVYELSEVQALELNLTEQINRADLSPLQEGEACRALMELSHYSVHQVAEKLGQSASWVTKRVALCGIAPELRKALSKGTLSVTLANALAALPTHQQQVKVAESLEARPDWEKRQSTAEKDAEWIRNTQCRPLADATWKLVDAELVLEAGACSACPHNSSNAKMPGLFDNAKAKPMCARVECFNDKELAAWLKRTEKQKAAGAKVLSLNECKKLFARGNDLGSASRYVEAGEKPPKDKQGRTWAELVADVPEEHRPQLHLAQDNGGKLRQLYVLDKVMEAAATHLKARWAKTVVEEATQKLSPERQAKRDAEREEERLVHKVRADVTQMVLDTIAVKQAAPGKFPVLAARFLASRCGERAVEKFAQVTGRKLRKDWLEKEATLEEALSLLWLSDVSDHLSPPPDGFDDELLRLAKIHGIDVQAATKAQLATAKAEAEKAKGA